MSEFIDLYEILNLSQDCTRNDIKKSFRELAKKHHPDHGGEPKMFQLITMAYEILIDKHERVQYDKIYEMHETNMNSHNKMKNESNSFKESQSVRNKTIDEVKNEFKKTFREMDLQQGIDRDGDKSNDKINKDEFERKYKDLESAREIDDIEDTPDKILDPKDKKFDEKFHKQFIQSIKKSAIVEYNDAPQPYVNDDNVAGYNNFGNIYANGGNFAENVSIMFVGEMKIDENKSVEELLRERELETTQLHKMRKADFIDEPEHKILSQNDKEHTYALELEDDIAIAYNDLIKMKKRS